MTKDIKYTDLLYFGYDWSDDGKENGKNQSDFISEIKEKFPDVILKDAYDSIKGFRQEVYLPTTENDNYFSWLIGKQWYNFSMSMNLIMMSGKDVEEKEKFDKYLALAKLQYPESFKPESLNK